MHSSPKSILVNASALSSGGALTILKQFIEGVEMFDTVNQYYIFTCKSELKSNTSNIVFVYLQPKGWLSRIIWDIKGVRQWAKKNGVTPNMIISLQNTGVVFPGTKQLVYYHQPLPLVGHKWNFFLKNERVLFLYKTIYPFFVKFSTRSDFVFVVQLNSIKEAFCKKYKVNNSNVFVLRPTLATVEVSKVKLVDLEKSKIHLIYPATAIPYKNHKVLIQALVKLKLLSSNIFQKLAVHFTVDQNTGANIIEQCKTSGVSDACVFHGNMSYETLLSYYKSCDALLFPSFVETFGLPLLEAAHFGLPILAADLPYSREVLSGYSGSNFIDYKDANAWANEIVNIKPSTRYEPLTLSNDNSWQRFFELVNKTIGNV